MEREGFPASGSRCNEGEQTGAELKPESRARDRGAARPILKPGERDRCEPGETLCTYVGVISIECEIFV